MTKEFLGEYKSKKAEIAELQYKLLHINGGDVMMCNDTILNYRKGYPVPEAVFGVDWDKLQRTEKRYKKRIETLTKECEEVEEFIESINDSLTRRIFRMYYVEGLSQKNISHAIHIDRSCISRKISNYFKNS